MKVTGTSHLGFIVKNLDTIINFYRSVLGLELLSGPSEEFHDINEGIAMGITGNPATHCHREAFMRTPDGVMLEFIEITDPVPVPIPETAACSGKLHLCLYVDDIQEWTKELAKHKVTPFLEPQKAELGDGTICYWVYFKDPEGMLFELQQIQI
ncbi:MAG: VOC family protein [Clostridiales bacterium]|nr:VOC family protein [Clostridiales bacterium]